MGADGCFNALQSLANKLINYKRNKYMKIKPTDTCYICGKPACSSEHAPARSFFPSDMRNNLIQVPSCEIHNEATSKDDEYVRFIISSHFRNNETGESVSTTKSVKTLKRSPALAKTLVENKIDATIISSDNSETQSTAIQIDRNRFDNEIRKIAYALFYNKFQKRWERELIIATPDLFDASGKVDEQGELVLLAKKMLSSISSPSYEGDNQQVFKYAFMETENAEEPILSMLFYEGFEIWVFPVTGSKGPKID